MLDKNGKQKNFKGLQKMIEEIHGSMSLSEEEEKVNSAFSICMQSQSALNKPFAFLVSCV